MRQKMRCKRMPQHVGRKPGGVQPSPKAHIMQNPVKGLPRHGLGWVAPGKQERAAQRLICFHPCIECWYMDAY